MSSRSDFPLYPAIQPYATHRLPVEDPHVLYAEECGNREGLPVVFLHGGPGAGCESWHRRFFNPNAYRIILLDQRGAGRSTPHAELGGNTTQALVADLEALREHLGIERWVVFGGSWGSTLGLVYAETHPQRVRALVLRGIFLCRPREIAWFYQEGASRLFPDYWESFLRPIPVAERSDIVSAYYKRLTGDDEVARMSAAKAWSLWEGRCATLLPKPSLVNHFGDPHVALSMARIECHYFVNDSFLEANQILNDIDKIANIPGIIVHGRYDGICPVENAWTLHKAWPGAELHIIPDAGHAAGEDGIRAALVKACDRFALRSG